MPFHDGTGTLAPRWENDCPDCWYVGRFVTVDGTSGDGWMCLHNMSDHYRGSVVFWLSDEIGDYWSLPLESVRRMRRDRDAGEPGAEGSIYTDILDKWEAGI